MLDVILWILFWVNKWGVVVMGKLDGVGLVFYYYYINMFLYGDIIVSKVECIIFVEI